MFKLIDGEQVITGADGPLCLTTHRVRLELAGWGEQHVDEIFLEDISWQALRMSSRPFFLVLAGLLALFTVYRFAVASPGSDHGDTILLFVGVIVFAAAYAFTRRQVLVLASTGGRIELAASSMSREALDDFLLKLAETKDRRIRARSRMRGRAAAAATGDAIAQPSLPASKAPGAAAPMTSQPDPARAGVVSSGIPAASVPHEPSVDVRTVDRARPGSRRMLGIILGGVAVCVIGGTAAWWVAASGASESTSSTMSTPPRSPVADARSVAPETTHEGPTQRQCPIAPWDGAVRGWARLGSAQCRQAGAETGYYLRVTFNQDKVASTTAVARAWRRYVEMYLASGACPSGREMMFFDSTGEVGAGILFPQMPPGWEAITQQEPQWRLLDGRNQPLTTPVCFFPAEESRRPAGWLGGVNPPSTQDRRSAQDGLDAEDATKSAAALGDSCYLDIRSGNLGRAEARCNLGLTKNPAQWTKGALLYNLGLIAEKRGQIEIAKSRYRESLAVRPTGAGVATVQAALDKLEQR